VEKITAAVARINRERDGGGWGPSRLRVMDFLVGHGKQEYREIGVRTLEKWKEKMDSLAALPQYYG